ncbi:MAG: lysophospholipid acyltransferase family protein [Bacteroidota bacterium]
MLVSKHEFIESRGLKKWRLAGAAGPLMKLTGIDSMNRLYDSVEAKEGLAFVEALFKQQAIRLEISGKGLEKLPKEGPFVTVSNHPFGFWDGLALLQLIQSQRPDFKVMANSLLEQIDPIQDAFIPVNPFDGNSKTNVDGLKKALHHLEEGKSLGIFPAGEVSSLHNGNIVDRVWSRSVIKLIRKAEVAVVPIYFEGSNSALFHLLGLLHPNLRTAAIPAENMRRKNTVIKIKVGNPISVKEIKAINGVDRLGRYLRARTYSLDTDLKVGQFYRRRPHRAPKMKSLAPEGNYQAIKGEVAALPGACLITEQQHFQVFLASAERIPHALQEIGRLRELTFREVGEGTQLARDLDEYDLYYQHLFLWDSKEHKIAGAYRLGMGADIMKSYGKKGFYTQSLFKIKNGFKPILEQAIELGRSFITPTYQRQRLPLFLLWRALHQLVHDSDAYRYLFGPVSISNDYSRLSRELIVALIKRYYSDEKLSGLVKPRKKFSPKLKKVEVDALLEGTENDLKKVDRLLEDLDPGDFRLPVLLKKYIKQNARIIAFNVDPKFSNSLDGMIVLDLKEIPAETEKMMASK